MNFHENQHFSSIIRDSTGFAKLAVKLLTQTKTSFFSDLIASVKMSFIN